MNKQQKPEGQRETSNGIAHDVEATMRANLSGRPELQGWISFASGIILLLHAFGYFHFINYVIIAIGAYLLFMGASKAHLIEKINNVYKWLRNKF